MKTILTATALSLFLTGCTSLHRSQNHATLDSTVKTNLHADIDVNMGQQVKGSARQTQVLWFFPLKSTNRYAEGVTYNGQSGGWSLFGPGLVEETKSAAAYNAVVPNKVDVLVAPQYLVKVKSYFFGIWKEVTANVTGYAGKIREIKSTKK